MKAAHAKNVEQLHRDVADFMHVHEPEKYNAREAPRRGENQRKNREPDRSR